MAHPLASYTGQSKEKVTLTVAVPRQPKKVASAAHGDLEFSYDKGAVTFTLPALSYGDIVRMD
jgi:hypothetical protein